MQPIFNILPDDVRTLLRIILRLSGRAGVHPQQLVQQLGWTSCRVEASLELLEEMGLVSRLPIGVMPTARGRQQLSEEPRAPSAPWTGNVERRRKPRPAH